MTHPNTTSRRRKLMEARTFALALYAATTTEADRRAAWARVDDITRKLAKLAPYQVAR